MRQRQGQRKRRRKLGRAIERLEWRRLLAVTPTITSSVGEVTNLDQVHVIVQFPLEVTGFDEGDLVVAGADVSDFNSSDFGRFEFNLAPTQDGLVTVDIPVGAAVDSNSEDTLAALQFSFTSDRTAPVITPPASRSVESATFLAAFASQAEITEFLVDTIANDAIDPDVPVTHDAPNIFEFGTTVVTFSASDDAGNVGTAQASITVTAPTSNDFCEGTDHWCDERWYANVRRLPDANLPIVPITLTDPSDSASTIVFAGNALEVAHDVTPGSDPVHIPTSQVFLSIGFNRPTSQAGQLLSTVRPLQFYSSDDTHIDAPVADAITLVEMTAEGFLNVQTELTSADPATGDQFKIENDYLLHPPTRVNAVTDVEVKITNTSGHDVTLAPNGAGEFHRRLSEQWVPITINSMFVARDWDDITVFPAWYQDLDPDGDYVSEANLNNGNLLDDGFSQNGSIAVSTHDVAEIETSNGTIVLDHETLLPVDVDGTDAIVLYRDSSDFVQLHHAHDIARNQRIDLTDASGLVNSLDELSWSVIYDRDDPNLVDGDNIQVRLTMDEAVADWPTDAMQSLSFRITSGDSRPIDLGDAPTAAQTSFANDYPTLLDDDGARHVIGSLFLGASIDEELNGQPSTNATADGSDEDGMIVIANAIAVGGTTTIASFSINASRAGLLDAWLDLNADGDWDDPGEQIATSLPLNAGANNLPYTISEDAVATGTVARFRLSTNGGLSPTGGAESGEVEDHMVTILDGATSPDANVNLVSTVATVIRQADRIVVNQNTEAVFDVPVENIGAMNIVGSDGQDFITLDSSGGSVSPSGGLMIDGGAGSNTLRVVGDGVVNLTSTGNLQARNFSSIDLRDVTPNQLVIDSASITAIAPAGTFAIAGGEGDQLVFADDDWRMGTTSVVGGQFRRQIVNETTGVSFDTAMPFGWHNLVNPLDVDNSGGPLTPFDALLGINVLSARQRDGVEGDALPDPTTIDPWPGHYVDTTGDDDITPFDVLQVINELSAQARQNRGSSEGIDHAITSLFAGAKTTSRQESRTESPDSALNESSLQAASFASVPTELASSIDIPAPTEDPDPADTRALDEAVSLLF